MIRAPLEASRSTASHDMSRASRHCLARHSGFPDDLGSVIFHLERPDQVRIDLGRSS